MNSPPRILLLAYAQFDYCLVFINVVVKGADCELDLYYISFIKSSES